MGYLIAFCFVCFDYITGLYKAGATHHFSSKIMRQFLDCHAMPLACLQVTADC